MTLRSVPYRLGHYQDYKLQRITADSASLFLVRLLYLPCLQIHQLLSDAPGRAQSRIIEPFIDGHPMPEQKLPVKETKPPTRHVMPVPAHPASKVVMKHVDDNSITIDSEASSGTESSDEEGNQSDNENIGDANSDILPQRHAELT